MKSVKPLVSIIVPIYNSETYLEKCIVSITKQTYKNLEIILIDDGSTDDSWKICNRFKELDKRIIIKNKKNGGQASARNVGLSIAQGSFFAFVDSDDWVSPNMIETLVDECKKNSADVVSCNFVLTDGKTEKLWTERFKDNLIFNNDQTMNLLLENKTVSEMFWNKLFKRELFNGKFFQEGMIFEDSELIHRVLADCGSYVYISTPLYYNFQSSNSTTRSKFSLKKFDRIDALKNRAAFYSKSYPTLSKKANGCLISICVEYIYLSKKAKDCRTARKDLIRFTKLFLHDNDVSFFKKAILAKKIIFLPDCIFSKIIFFSFKIQSMFVKTKR